MLSGIPEIGENHETLGKNIHFPKDPLGLKKSTAFPYGTEHTQSV
jgi:hypothetical protein